ncbi:hypothetical protein [Acetobacter sp. P1H12_c]|uniref:hypothetical protein n=1 Tax=Acetobacter sp. P1H12_c TaxID=2762621 RepID=UPI001C058B95|nr:hypothetical protein [Acetobacter sp. P1H12_c]
MTRDCIVIPVHLPKANWLISFLSSIEAQGGYDNFEIILGASNEHEYRMFARMIPAIHKKLKVKYVNIEGFIKSKLKSDLLTQRFIANTDRCIVNVKKFILLIWALEHGYHGIMSLDADTAASKSLVSLFSSLRLNYRKNIYIGTSYERGDITTIADDCRRHFGDKAKDIFQSSDGKIVYTWFFDAPFYESTDLAEFFDRMSQIHGSLVKWLMTIRYEDFEHTIFQYWRAIEKGSVFFDTQSFTHNFLPESYLYSHLATIYDATMYCPTWIYTWEFLHQPDILAALPDVHMLSHFDRMGLYL